jgi:hypothetical protein
MKPRNGTMTRDLTIWTELSVTAKDGRVLRGWYRTYDGMVSVETTTASKTTQIGGSDPTSLAYIMLRELGEDEETGFKNPPPSGAGLKN